MERAVLQNIYHPKQALYRDMVPIRGMTYFDTAKIHKKYKKQPGD